MERSLDSLPPGFDGLVALVKILRSDRGCPWDREQTAEQIKTYLLEEAYELLEALDSQDPMSVSAELGDLLFHIVFLSRIFEEARIFDMEDVIRSIVEKMIRRHPHVFGQTRLSNADEVRRQWQEIKREEAGLKHSAKSAPLDSVPRNLPALMRAYRICERAGRLGAEKPSVDEALQRVDHTLRTFKESVKTGDTKEQTERLGNLLFAMVHVARSIHVHPESALAQTTEKFVGQFDSAPEMPKE